MQYFFEEVNNGFVEEKNVFFEIDGETKGGKSKAMGQLGAAMCTKTCTLIKGYELSKFQEI